MIRLFFLHNFFRGLLAVGLNIGVQTDLKVISRRRLHPALPDPVNLDAPGVGGSQDFSVDSFQHLLVLNFQANNPLVIPSCKSQDFEANSRRGNTA